MFATDHCAAAAREPGAFIPVAHERFDFFPGIETE
jgi:hypothetical protein